MNRAIAFTVLTARNMLEGQPVGGISLCLKENWYRQVLLQTTVVIQNPRVMVIPLINQNLQGDRPMLKLVSRHLINNGRSCAI